MLPGEGDTSVLNFTYVGLLSSLFHLPYFKASIWYLPPSQSPLKTQAHKMTETVLEQEIQNIMSRGEEKLKGKKKISQPSKQHLNLSLFLLFPYSVISILL